MTLDLWLASYTPPHGSGQGISAAAWDGAAFTVGGLLAGAKSPSFVTQHPSLDVLYAVEEHEGRLLVLRREGDAYVAAQTLPAGAAACHVRVEADGSGVTVACWGDGAVLHYLLDDNGLVTTTLRAPAVDADATRAHASAALPTGGFVTTDLGADLLRRFRVADGALAEVDRLQLPAGVGPRHLVVHEEWLFVVTEFSNEVLVVGWPGALELVGRHPVRATGADGDACAEIAHVGGWLTVGVRGSDVLAVLRIVDDPTKHVIELEPAGEVATGGSHPRHHLHVPGAVLVCNQLSDQVTVLPFDEATGRLGPAAAVVPAASPTQLAPLRR